MLGLGVLIITSNRELATQTHAVVSTLLQASEDLQLYKHAIIIGGTNKHQENGILNKGEAVIGVGLVEFDAAT